MIIKRAQLIEMQSLYEPTAASEPNEGDNNGL